ncbi:BACON domain-containing protein [Alistipes communis]|uniref:BACON domain-containing protein n=1 Tax=Alistipes communis TaxID=2585118 RepID=UPI00242A3B14|nr:BACON domain-containing protein [Alistipes communis]
MNLFHKIGLAVAASAALFAACSSDDDPFFARENDYLTFDCNEQTVEQSLQCDGAWSIDYDGNDDWIAVTPDSGVGNGELDFITVGVAYNRGGERTGTIYIDFAGHAYPIHITQGACDFAYGALSSAGTLVRGVESDFTLILAYANANGDESVALSCRMTGASEGLVAADCTFDKFQKGSGTITMPVIGVPAQTGEVFFELLVDGESKGTVKSTVVADPSSIVGGFPVWWDFSSREQTDVDGGSAQLQLGSRFAVSLRGFCPFDRPQVSRLERSRRLSHRRLLDGQRLGLRRRPLLHEGVAEGRLWLMAFPVKNLKEGTRIAFEAAVGCSGSGARYYALEYSADGTNWFLAEGAETVTGVDGSTGPAHYTVMTDQALPTTRRLHAVGPAIPSPSKGVP